MQLILWILSLFGWPKPVKDLTVQNANVTWKDPANLTGVEVSMRVVGAPSFTALSTVAKGVQALAIPNLDDGDYEVKCVVVNKTLKSAGVVKSFTVLSAPGEVTNLAVALS